MKKLLAILLSAIMLSTCCASLCACSIFGFSNTDIFGIGQPKISAYGNVIYWEAVADAAEYQVYAEGASIGTTTDTYYVLDDLSVDSDITVTAKNAQGKESKESNAITVQQSVGFVDEETMEIELTSEKEYKVSSNVKFVKVSGEASSVGFTIEKNRTDDLYVELDQVTMVSGATNNCFRTENNIMDAEELKFAVIFILKGNSALTGASITTVPEPQTEANSQKKGINGESGRTPIVLPTVIMTGNGDLTLKGGDGGNGGTGAPSSGMSTSLYGDGGNGGEGGGGLKCTTLVLALGKGCRVFATGGNGGEGGSPGSNGSLVSGPVGTLAWDLHFGADGSVGKNLTGQLVTFSGKFA